MAYESCQTQTQPQIVSVNELVTMQRKRVLDAEKAYVESMKKALEELKKIAEGKDKDRMELAFLLSALISLMGNSIRGWQKWCTIEKMQYVSKEKDFDKIIERMTELVIQWISIDIEITGQTIDKMEKEMGTKAESTKGKRKSKKVDKPFYT